MKVCSIEGCDKKVIAKNLCTTHYKRLQRTGSTDDPEFINKGKTCSMEGCDHDAVALGICDMHHKRLMIHNDPNVVLQLSSYNGAICLVPKCDEKMRSKCLCNKHYKNYTYHVNRGNLNTIQEYFEFLRNKEKRK